MPETSESGWTAQLTCVIDAVDCRREHSNASRERRRGMNWDTWGVSLDQNFNSLGQSSHTHMQQCVGVPTKFYTPCVPPNKRKSCGWDHYLFLTASTDTLHSCFNRRFSCILSQLTLFRDQLCSFILWRTRNGVTTKLVKGGSF